LRTRGEARLLEKAGKLIDVPKVLKVDEKNKEIDMEFIDGEKLSDKLDSMKNWQEVCLAIGENIAKLHDAGIIHGDLTTSNMIWNSPQLSVAAEISNARSARSHAREDIKNPSRVMRSPTQNRTNAKLSHHLAIELNCDDNVRGCYEGKKDKNGKLYFIDFGLGFANGRTEDKAVDLYLIKEALEAKHFARWDDYWKEVLGGYKKTSKKVDEVLKRLEKVEKRGRYKGQY
jgi:tRNA A-37 threonylcarbamoyl transferase component Bud32